MALDKNFFQTLPKFKKVSKSNAQIAWLVYELALVNNNGHESFSLKKVDQVYTEFEPALLSITTPAPGNVHDFIQLLQEKLDEQLEVPPTTKVIEKPF